MKKVVNLSMMFLFLIFSETTVFADNVNFIRAENEVFMDGTDVFYFTGTNCYYLMEFASETMGGYKTKVGVDEVLNESKLMGLKVIRTWAFSDYLQPSQGVYNEDWLKGLDYVLNKANLLDLRIILVLVNNWPDPYGHYRGIDKYVNWSSTAATHDDFYSDVNTRLYYKQHATKLINRVNFYNGKVYMNDPTIFSWELCNEPRAESHKPFSSALDGWIEEMSTYIKSIDPNHMVSTGLEGFYRDKLQYYSNWMGNGDTGTDFIDNHNHPNIDFATIHCLPDDWGVPPSSMNVWVTLHLNDTTNYLNMPMIVEELAVKRGGGGDLSERDNTFREISDISYYLNAGGFMFWISYGNDYPDYDGYGVYYPDDTSTVVVISDIADKMNSKTSPFWNILLPVKRAYCGTPEKSGAGASKLILEYLDEGSTYSYDVLYTFGHDFNEPPNAVIPELDPTAVKAIMNAYKLPEYNFSVVETDTVENLLKYICHWMDFEVSGVDKPSSPVTLPIMTGYDHWVVVNGASADLKPNANLNPGSLGTFTVYGLVLMDPVFGPDFIGHQVFKTASELTMDYIKPLVTLDKYNGKFVAVAEPPVFPRRAFEFSYEDKLQGLKVKLADPIINSYTDGYINKYRSKSGSEFTTSDIQKIIDPRVFIDPDFTEVFHKSTPFKPYQVEDLTDWTRNYHIVPMGDHKTKLVNISVLLDAKDGHFRELSWLEHGRKYLEISKDEALNKILQARGNNKFRKSSARLIYTSKLEGCSLYYPAWEFVINGAECWIVTQDGHVRLLAVTQNRPPSVTSK